MEASNNGRANIVSFLLENGATVDKLNKHGMTALWCAVYSNHVDTVRLLLEKGADSTWQPYDKETYSFPLHRAASMNNPDVCKLLLKFGADLDQKFKGGTSLQIATQNKHTNVIKILQAATAKKNDERRKVIIANIAEAKTGQEKEEMTKMYEGLFEHAEAGDITAFQRMQNLPKHQFDINWANKDNGLTF